MKKRICFLALVICLPFFIIAQTVEITPFGGYVFPGTLNADGGNVHFLGNAQYGGMISIGVSRVMDVELIYNRSDTKADVNIYGWSNNSSYTQVPLSINYMLVGFTKNFRVNPVVSPFVGFDLGACLFYPKEVDGTQYQDSWLFAMGISGGAKVYFSKRVDFQVGSSAIASPVNVKSYSPNL